MEKKPFHHNSDGTFRNPEGSPERDSNSKWSYKVFIEERKKIKIDFPPNHVVPRSKVLEDLEKNKNEDYIAWIGHATFLIKLGDTTIITDPVFSKNTGPLIFGPKRYVKPAIKLNEIPPINLFLLTHNHYDHQDMSTIRNFPYKKAKVILPLKLSKYFRRFDDVNELDWYEEIQVNKDLKITLLPAVHWSKRSLTDTNKTLWGNFLIEYKDKKILVNAADSYLFLVAALLSCTLKNIYFYHAALILHESKAFRGRYIKVGNSSSSQMHGYSRYLPSVREFAFFWLAVELDQKCSLGS